MAYLLAGTSGFEPIHDVCHHEIYDIILKLVELIEISTSNGDLELIIMKQLTERLMSL